MTQSFQYDDLYQLTYAEGYYQNPIDYDEVKEGTYTQNFAYDSIGNMRSETRSFEQCAMQAKCEFLQYHLYHKDSHQGWLPSSAGNKHTLNYNFDYFYDMSLHNRR